VLEEVIDELNEAGIFVAVCGAQRNVLKVLREAGDLKAQGRRWYCPSSAAAVKRLQRGLDQPEEETLPGSWRRMAGPFRAAPHQSSRGSG
jgi:hypothetical protein